MIDFKKVAEEVDEAIRVLDLGDVPECLKRCERIVAELRKGSRLRSRGALVKAWLNDEISSEDLLEAMKIV